MEASLFTGALGRTAGPADLLALLVLALVLLQSGWPASSGHIGLPGTLRRWWAAHRATIAGLGLWALALGWLVSCNPIDASRQDRPYRVEAAEGAVFMMRAASQDACEADTAAQVVCSVAANEP